MRSIELYLDLLISLGSVALLRLSVDFWTVSPAGADLPDLSGFDKPFFFLILDQHAPVVTL